MEVFAVVISLCALVISAISLWWSIRGDIRRDRERRVREAIEARGRIPLLGPPNLVRGEIVMVKHPMTGSMIPTAQSFHLNFKEEISPHVRKVRVMDCPVWPVTAKVNSKRVKFSYAAIDGLKKGAAQTITVEWEVAGGYKVLGRYKTRYGEEIFDFVDEN